MFVVCLKCLHLIAQEVRHFRTGVSNEGLFLAQFQVQCLLEECRQLAFNLLRFGFGSHETKQEVISITTVPEAAKVWVLGSREGMA